MGSLKAKYNVRELFFFGFVFVSFSAFFVGLGSILNSFRLFFRVDKVG